MDYFSAFYISFAVNLGLGFLITRLLSRIARLEGILKKIANEVKEFAPKAPNKPPKKTSFWRLKDQ